MVLHETESLCKVKDTVNRTKWQATYWERIFTNPTLKRGFIFKIYKELKLYTNKPNNPIKKWGTQLNRDFLTEKSQMTEKPLEK